MRGGLFLELTKDGLGGTERTALRKSDVGPVGVRVGVVYDGDKESKLVGISEGLQRGGIK